MKRLQAGFTLVELVIAITLLAAMVALLWGGLSFAIRGWDSGELFGRRTVDLRIAQNFLRRELMEMFPMRFKEATVLKYAFSGEAQRLRFVSARPAGLSEGGLALVGLEVESQDAGRVKNLVMRRALPDDAAKDFGPLDQAKPMVLIADVEEIRFAYFGSDSDVNEPRWSDDWTYAARIPMLVRLRVKTADGRALPDFVTRVVMGEEAGCLESAFQRGCRPRRP